MWTPPPQASPFPGGEKEMPGHVVPTYNTCSNTNRGFDRLRLRYVGASSSRVRLATPDGPSQRISHGRPFFRLLPLRLPRPLPSCPPGASPCHRRSPTQSRSSSSQSIAIASPPALVLLVRVNPFDCGGQPPHTWHDDLRGLFETLFQRRVDGLKPASTCLWTVPRAQALLRGRAWVAQLWVKSVGAVRLRALPFSLVQQGCLRCGVSRCGPAAAVVERGC